MKWVRATDGAFLGVCKGMAQALDISVGLTRFLWILSVLFLGFGFLLYFLLAFSLPRADRQAEALKPRILGVCARVAVKTEIEVGLVRFLAICLALMSFGATVVGYIVLHFVLEQKPNHTSDNNPSTPPAIT